MALKSYQKPRLQPHDRPTTTSLCAEDNVGTQHKDSHFKLKGPQNETRDIETDCSVTDTHTPKNFVTSISDETSSSTNMSEDMQGPSHYLKKLEEGKRECGDSYVPFSKPPWFDAESFRRGQQFAVRHLAAILMSELLALMLGLLFSVHGTFEPMVFTDMSDTPFKAFKRYLSTVTHVRSWYEDDIWDPKSAAHHSLKAVRKMHESVRKRMNNSPEEELAKKITLEGQENTAALLAESQQMLNDIQENKCPFLGTKMTTDDSCRYVFMNQYDMVITQAAFATSALIFPKEIGIYNATEADLEGFAHFWRTIGYVLGMKDEYNLCDGDLATVQQRCTYLMRMCVLPLMRTVSREGIHMARCVFEGVTSFLPPLPSFQAFLLFACHITGARSLHFKSPLSFWQILGYYQLALLTKIIYRIPGMHAINNKIVRFSLDRAQNFSKEKLLKMEQKMCPYKINKNKASFKIFNENTKFYLFGILKARFPCSNTISLIIVCITLAISNIFFR